MLFYFRFIKVYLKFIVQTSNFGVVTIKCLFVTIINNDMFVTPQFLKPVKIKKMFIYKKTIRLYWKPVKLKKSCYYELSKLDWYVVLKWWQTEHTKIYGRTRVESPRPRQLLTSALPYSLPFPSISLRIPNPFYSDYVMIHSLAFSRWL